MFLNFRTVKSVARGIFRRRLHRRTIHLPYAFIGTEYGGWPLLIHETRPGSLIYSFGIGQDISFDIGAIERFGCLVEGFDPTPKSIAWVRAQPQPKGFVFNDLGLAGSDGEARFFAPTHAQHVSFSISPTSSEGNSESVIAHVLRLESIVHKKGGREPEILKMDIEGFEYEVVEDILKGPMRPKQMLVEFHHGMYGLSDLDTIKAVSTLRSSGYQIFYVSSSGREYAFVYCP